MPFVHQIGSLDKEYVLKTIALMRKYEFQGPVPAELENSVVSVEVPCLTFDELMEKYAVERVDFLNIDAEGCDYELFCSIDLGRYRPAVLCLETVELSESQDREVRGRLEELGYRFLERFDLYSEIFLLSA